MSPGFASDGTGFCAGERRDRTTGSVTGIALYVTTDAGRTWRAAAGDGLGPVTSLLRLDDLFVSPRFGADRSVFVVVNSRLYASRDLAQSFQPVDHGTSGLRFTPFAAPHPLDTTGEPRTLVIAPSGISVDIDPADAEETWTIVVDPLSGARTLVHGSPDRDEEFAIAPSFASGGPAFVMAVTQSGESARRRLYRCDATLTCDTVVHAFPAGWTLDRMWLLGRSLYVSMSTPDGRVTLWRSADGRRLSRWTAAERLYGNLANVAFGLAAAPGARELYLRLSGNGDLRPGAAPYEQLFRSQDGGSSWRLVSFGRLPQQPGPRGSMPANTPRTDAGTPYDVLVVAGTRLFTVGETAEGPRGERLTQSFFCSRDVGRTWRRTC